MCFTNCKLWIVTVAFMLFSALTTAMGGTKNWKAATAGDWFTTNNWMEGVCPVAGDDVVITNTGASVLLTNSTAYLGSITLRAPGVSANTLVFSNWNTTLSATNVYVQTNATVTLPLAFTNGAMSNNVYILCSNLMIEAGASINVDSRGYAKGLSAAGSQTGSGPGGGVGSYASGAGHGGIGGGGYDKAYGGLPYDSTNAPVIPGSGGGGSAGWGNGSDGGGAVRIQAVGTVTVNGRITANGQLANGGGGSGGAIYIQCNHIAGANGLVCANGGSNPGNWSGPGGGGRIAINYNAGAQTDTPLISFQTLPGTNGTLPGYPSDLGTIWFTDSRLLPETITTNLCGQVWGVSSWAPQSLIISNSWVRFPEAGFQLNVTNNMLITGSSGKFQLGGTVFDIISAPILYGLTSAPVINVGGNLILTNGGSLYVYNAQTNAATPDYGALVNVNGDVVIASNAWIYSQSHPTNGGSTLFRMRNLFISASGGMTNPLYRIEDNIGGSRSQGGYSWGASWGWTNVVPNGYGPGGGSGGSVYTTCGGGYGGTGGQQNATFGLPYGSSNAPMYPGSAGGSGAAGGWVEKGGFGGALYRIIASGQVTVNGTISVRGGNNKPGVTSSAGSGGGIYVRCRRIAGDSSGVLNADGGSSDNGGGGGGGRIAAYFIYDSYSGSKSVLGGPGRNAAGTTGTVGTIYWQQMPPPGTIFTGR